MRVSFVIASDSIEIDKVTEAVGRAPDVSHRKGEYVVRSSTKTYETNIHRYELVDTRDAKVADRAIVAFLVSVSERWPLLEPSYRYVDFVIEKRSLTGDFCLSGALVERLRALDTQIQVDITRY